MLLRIFILISVLAAAAICYFSGCFLTLHWLWVLPVSMLGLFLLCLLLAFVFLMILCNRVDLQKQEDDDHPFYRQAMYLYEELIATLLGVRIHTSGTEKIPAQGRFLVVCNHIFDFDPAFLHLVFRKSQLAFISKQENQSMFVVGKMMHMTLCQPINRENNREALKTILKCVQIVQEDKASIAVFPEGYVSKDRCLHPFRPGVFKIAQKANIPIVVCTVRNTHKIIPNAKKLKPTHVYLNVLGVLSAEEVKSHTTVALSDRVHAMMAQDLGPQLLAER